MIKAGYIYRKINNVNKSENTKDFKISLIYNSWLFKMFFGSLLDPNNTNNILEVKISNKIGSRVSKWVPRFCKSFCYKIGVREKNFG